MRKPKVTIYRSETSCAAVRVEEHTDHQTCWVKSQSNMGHTGVTVHPLADATQVHADAKRFIELMS